MRHVYARELLHLTKDEMLELCENDEEILLEFDDEQIVTNWPQTYVSWFAWEFHREYFETPLYCHVHVMGEMFSPELQLKILQRCKNDVKEANPDVSEEDLDELCYEVTNEWHNTSVGDLEEYMGTMDALAFLQIWQHKGIQDARALIHKNKSKRTVNVIYGKIREILLHSPEFRENPVAISMRQGTIKVGQLLQIVAMRGYCSEINQKIYREIIPVGFQEGLTRASFFAMESRSASTALRSTDDPVKITEYYNRELQLLNYSVTDVSMDDCGSDETYPWEVSADDLDRLLPGKYYMVDGKPVVIRKKDRFLIGKVIDLRHPAYCHHPDDGVVCRYCLGEVARSFQKGSNVQFQATVTQNEGVSQSTISVKHLLLSAESESYSIDPFYQEYFDNTSNEKDISLTQNAWSMNDVTLSLDLRDVVRLSDINLVPDFSTVDVSTFSRIRNVVLSFTKPGHKDRVIMTVPMNHGSYTPFLTAEFLNYIRDYGYDVDNGKIVVSMTHWPDGEVIFRLPDRRGTTLEAAIALKKEIFAIGDEAKEAKLRLRMDLRDPMLMSKAMRDIATLTNNRFNISLPIIELVMYAMMARDPDNGDYRLPRKGTGMRFASQKAIMNGRSLSGKAAHERQYEMVISPSSYLIEDRPDMVFDQLLVPEPE